MISRLTVIALAACFAGAVTLHAQETASDAEPATTMFALTCMQHYYSQDMLVEQMKANGVAEVPSQNAGFFLRGKKGKAWVVVEQEGRFVISLREDGICAVFAQKADAAAAHKNFANLVSIAPEPMQASLRTTDAPNSGDMKSVSYAWFRPNDKSELTFTLTTSTSETATVQAMASMGITKRND